MARRAHGNMLTNQLSLETTSTMSNGDGRKRVVKACERCRVKKVKCCGSTPCTRCELDDVVCYFGSRGKVDEGPVPAARANQLQVQQDVLIRALRVLWRRTQADCSSPMLLRTEEPSIHEIVKSTGVLSEPCDPVLMQSGVDLENLFNEPLHEEPDNEREADDTFEDNFGAHHDAPGRTNGNYFVNGARQAQGGFNEYSDSTFSFGEPLTLGDFGHSLDDTAMPHYMDFTTASTTSGIQNDLYAPIGSPVYANESIPPSNMPQSSPRDQLWPTRGDGKQPPLKSTYDFDLYFDFNNINT